jgi:isopentenyldiphosphate isomerase
VPDGTVAGVTSGSERPDSAGPGAELVEVVDADGTVLDVVTRARMRSERLRHRCTFVVVRDPAGRVLVHQRSPHKDMWPSRWDLAAGGVVQAGEDWDLAAARELQEEVGVVEVPLVPLAGGATLAYDDADVAELARIWTVVWDGPVTFGDGEVVAARWVTVDELRHLVATEPFVPDSVALVLPLVLVDPGRSDENSP